MTVWQQGLTRWSRSLAVAAAVMVTAAACGGTSDDGVGDDGVGNDGRVEDGGQEETEDLATLVLEACRRTVALHDEIATIFNDVAAIEVDASEEERGKLLADGFDAMIDAAETAQLADAPAELVVGLEERRRKVVADMRNEAEEYRTTWQRVTTDDRSSAVPQILVRGEKLMSETEPRLRSAASPELIRAVETTPECRHVIQGL